MFDIESVLKDIGDERDRQIVLWGHVPDKTIHYFVSVLVEEVGELAKAGLEFDRDGLYEEAIQIGAVAAQIAQYNATIRLGNN